jgi:formate hydrogenlyase subunit 6/NADH:ubiquinone oxidoreductase subunit I
MLKYFQKVWMGVYTVLIGMRITIIHLFAHNVTVQYPNEQIPIPDNARNRLYVDMEECNGCNSCARACPVNCITVETIKCAPGDEVPPLRSGGKRALWVSSFEIDFAKCCFCSLCTEPCPTMAIRRTKEFEYSDNDRKNLIYNFVKQQGSMTVDKIAEKKELLAQSLAAAAAKRKEEEEKKAAEGQ